MTTQQQVTSITTKHWSDYVWPSMCTNCKNLVLQCALCACNKLSRHRPYGLLQPLLVPDRPWQCISMEFIEQLPAFNGFAAMLVVIEPLSKEMFSFQLQTLLLPWTLQMHSFPMCYQSMASLSMCPLTVDRNSPLTSSSHSAPFFECAYTPRLATAPQPKVRQNGPTASWNSTFVCITTTAGQLIHGPPAR